MTLKKFCFAILTLSLASCDQANQGAAIAVPNAGITCTDAVCAQSGTFSAVVILTQSGCAVDQIELEPIAIGTTNVTCDGTQCTGVVSSWRDENSATVRQITARRYDICGLIDFDNNSYDAGDAVSSANEFVGGGPLLIENWSPL